jgi:hypothetical protein
MRLRFTLLAVMASLLTANWASAGGITHVISAREYFLANQLTMERYFDKEALVKSQDNADLRGDIYQFKPKSPFKAFALSLAVPGAGEFYTGSRIKAGAFFAVDVILWSGYLMYHHKGKNEEGAYRSYADKNYKWTDYISWWNTLSDSAQKAYSHRLPIDASGNPIKNWEYYENIGKYDQFQVGWQDVGLNHPPPEKFYSALRNTYLSMRQTANDYFSNATTTAMVSIANHIISAFDAAIGARKYNKGSKQYSLYFDSKNINGRQTPFLVMTAKF